MKPDLYDLIVILGLIVAIAGIWMLSRPWALIIGGLGFMLLGVIGAVRKAELKRGKLNE
jgi:hypothetical protein